VDIGGKVWHTIKTSDQDGMHRRKFFLVAVSLANAISPALLAGVPSKKAVYRGGTLARLEPPAKGEVSTTDEDEFVFRYHSGELRVPYNSVNSLEYGQKAGRRLGLSIALSPLFLLSKKRRHYLTLGFRDSEGSQQAVVLELGKDIVRTTLVGLEAQTGLKVEFEDEEARRSSRW
jgi:hypothetical protein